MAFNEIREVNNSEIENLIHAEEEELRRMQIAEELEAEGPILDTEGPEEQSILSHLQEQASKNMEFNTPDIQNGEIPQWQELENEGPVTPQPMKNDKEASEYSQEALGVKGKAYTKEEMNALNKCAEEVSKGNEDDIVSGIVVSMKNPQTKTTRYLSVSSDKVVKYAMDNHIHATNSQDYKTQIEARLKQELTARIFQESRDAQEHKNHQNQQPKHTAQQKQDDFKETKVIYEGFFLKDEEKENAMAFVDSISEMSGGERLDKVIGDMHITTGFGKNAQGFDITAIGDNADIEITGYANDGRNEAISVSLSSENPDLQAKFDKLQNPHITISVADGARPFDSGKLNFEPLPDYFAGEFKLTGQYGVFTDRGVVATREQAERIFEVKLNKPNLPMNNKDLRT